MILKNEYDGLSGAMVEGVCQYIMFGIPPGGFLGAVFANDLQEAAARADNHNLHNLHVYAGLLHGTLPASSVGSREAVESWCKLRREFPLGPSNVRWPTPHWKENAEALWLSACPDLPSDAGSMKYDK